MKAKEFITELNMAPGNLMKFVFSSPIVQNMRAGFEAELIIPGEFDSDADSELDWDKDSTLPRNIDLDDIREFFHILSRSSRSNLEKVEQEYMDWAGEGASAWIEENIAGRISYLQEEDPELDDESARDEAWDELHSEYTYPPYYDFFKAHRHNTWSDISSEYGFDWPYFKESSFEDSVSGYEVALGKAVNATVQVSNSYHGGRKEFSKGYWYIEPDESISTDESGFMGIEVVSPPMNPLIMLGKLKKTLEWADDMGAQTNESTGLHVGVSIGGQSTQNLDYVKLVLFLGDKYILDRFGRARNTYTQSSMEILNRKVAYGGKNIMLGAIDQLKRGLAHEASKSVLSGDSNSRHVSINMREDYVEFRSMGYDYLNHYDAIQNTILRYIRAYAVASDPMAERQEYFKKLSKLLNPSNEDRLIPFIKYSAGLVSKSELVSQLSLFRPELNIASDQTPQKLPTNTLSNQ